MRGRVLQRCGLWCALVTADFLSSPIELRFATAEEAVSALEQMGARAELGEVAA